MVMTAEMLSTAGESGLREDVQIEHNGAPEQSGRGERLGGADLVVYESAWAARTAAAPASWGPPDRRR